MATDRAELARITRRVKSVFSGRRQVQIACRAYAAGTLVLGLSICLIAGCSTGSGGTGSGYGYAIAYAPATSPSAVEVRTSTDGSTWSPPSIPFESSSIPPGIGATTDRYVLAWFGPSSTSAKVLHTAMSTNGTAWEFHATHGTFGVGPNSRPAVEYNFNTKSWLVAFRDELSRIVVIPVDGPNANARVISGVSTDYPPGLGWNIDRLVLVYRASGGALMQLTSPTGLSWPPGPGTPITVNGATVIAQDGPYLNRTLASLWLTAQSLTPIPSTGTLSTGNIRVFTIESGAWELVTIINQTNPASRGSAVTGVPGALVIAQPGVRAVTELWRNGQAMSPLDTRTGYEVSLAYGPRATSAVVLPDLICGPCDRCQDSVGGLAPDFFRECTDRAGNGQTFRCHICDICVAGSQTCRPPQLSGDAPGYSEPVSRGPCRSCPRP